LKWASSKKFPLITDRGQAAMIENREKLLSAARSSADEESK